MMTLSVKMLMNVTDTSQVGGVLVKGTTYSLPDAQARELVFTRQADWATTAPVDPTRRPNVYVDDGGTLRSTADNSPVSGDGSGGDDLSDALLTEMGYNRADVAALPTGIKSAASWLVALRALDQDRLDNATNGISKAAYARDYSGYVGENVQKWITTEATKGVYDYSRVDLLESQLPVPPAKRAMHCLFGQNGYQPSWVATELGSTPANLDTLVANRVASAAAKWPNDPFYRIDVVNEILSNASSSPSAANYTSSRGWRTSNNANYTAAATNNPSNPAYWVWQAFTAARAAFPSAKLCWNDYDIETVYPPDAYNKAVLPAFYRTNTKSGSTVSLVETSAYHATNQKRDVVAKIDRLRYEVWRMRSNSVPIDVVGYQLHIDVLAPPNWDDLQLCLQDWNRFGITPAITELNARSTASGTAVGVLPPHLQQSGTDALHRYGAYLANAYVKQFLTHSLCEEVTWWSQAMDSAGDGQTATRLSRDYPIRKAVMLAIAGAQAPGSRALKRGTRINAKNVMPLWVSFAAGSASNLAFSSNRTAINGTSGTSLQVDWKWCNDTWMPRPISAADLVIDAQFQLSANPAADTVLMGYGNATSGTPTNKVELIISSAGALRLEVTVGGLNVLTQQISASVSTATDHRVAVRINGTGISYTYDGGTVGTATATGSFSDQTAIYLLSRPDATASSANLGAYFWELHHGADYNSNALLQGLSTPIIRDVSTAPYLGY